MNGFRQLAYAAPPLLLAIATFWLNRDGLERQRSIARTESRRSISVWGFKANGPYVDEPRVLLARNRGAGTPFLLTADSRRPAADERAVLEAMSWEAAPDTVGFGPVAEAPGDALLVVPSDRRTASTRASLARDGWMLAGREGGTEAWTKQASGDGFYWEPDELAAAVETERASSAPAPFLGGTVRNALAEAFALLCLLLPLAVGWRRAGEAGIVVALAAETAVPAVFLAFGLGNAACAFAVPFAALAAAMSVRGPTRPREQFSMVAAGLLFATCAACVLTHTLFATNGLGTIGGKAKILHLCAGVPEGFFRDPNRAVLQPAYPPGFPLLAYAFFCLEGGASQWLVQLVPCAAQAFCLLLLCRSAPSRIWIPFLAAVFLSDPALCLTTMFYAEPLACVFLLCGWNLLEEGRTRQGWLALGMTAWIKNEFVLFPALVWFVRRVLLRDCRCRIEHAIAALVPFVAWFIVSRALGAELYDYAPPAMNENIEFLGPYRLNGQTPRHAEPYWHSTVTFNGLRKTVVDAAGMGEDGRNVVRLLPYQENVGCPQIDDVLRDGDLLAYVQGPKEIVIPSDATNASEKMIEHIGDVLKGRATHAELGYVNENGKAMQVSLWGRSGPMQAEDRRFSVHTNSDTISIYRASLSGYNVDSRTETLLKAEMKRWKELVKPVYFPVGTEMNVDPVDFTTMSELRDVAEGFVNHSPSDTTPPFRFKFNCVQWSTLVFSLAVCFPLSVEMLKQAGLFDGYEKNWANRLGYAKEGLVGIDELPIPFYTMEEIVENTLDLYLPEYKGVLASALKTLPLQQILSKLGVADSKRVMPNAFVIENRLRGLGFKRKTKTTFQYVATAAPERELQIV